MTAAAVAAAAAAAEQRRAARRRSMLPGSSRDVVVRVAKVALPAAAIALFLVLLLVPLTRVQEFSFLLSKDSAMRAGERMAVRQALYRGETVAGEAFRISAESGVQKSSAEPVVMLTGLAAEIERAGGLVRVTAPTGAFHMNTNQVVVDGPVVARSQSGYSLDGARIVVDINENRVTSDQPVRGTLPSGQFAADRFEADLEGGRVLLDGRASLRLSPSGSRS